MAYALNGYRAGSFRHRADPFSVEIAASRVDRDAAGYLLSVVTPSVGGIPIRAEVRFRPADATVPFERDLGTPRRPPRLDPGRARLPGRGGGSPSARMSWISPAGATTTITPGPRTCRSPSVGGSGGRAHDGPLTHVYYRSEPRDGPTASIALTCRDGRPEAIREGLEASGVGRPAQNVFGIRHDPTLGLSRGDFHLSRTVGPLPGRRAVLPPMAGGIRGLRRGRPA